MATQASTPRLGRPARSPTRAKFWWEPKRPTRLDDMFDGKMDFVSIDIAR